MSAKRLTPASVTEWLHASHYDYVPFKELKRNRKAKRRAKKKLKTNPTWVGVPHGSSASTAPLEFEFERHPAWFWAPCHEAAITKTSILSWRAAEKEFAALWEDAYADCWDSELGHMIEHYNPTYRAERAFRILARFGWWILPDYGFVDCAKDEIHACGEDK